MKFTPYTAEGSTLMAKMNSYNEKHKGRPQRRLVNIAAAKAPPTSQVSDASAIFKPRLQLPAMTSSAALNPPRLLESNLQLPSEPMGGKKSKAQIRRQKKKRTKVAPVTLPTQAAAASVNESMAN